MPLNESMPTFQGQEGQLRWDGWIRNVMRQAAFQEGRKLPLKELTALRSFMHNINCMQKRT